MWMYHLVKMLKEDFFESEECLFIRSPIGIITLGRRNHSWAKERVVPLQSQCETLCTQVSVMAEARMVLIQLS